VRDDGFMPKQEKLHISLWEKGRGEVLSPFLPLPSRLPHKGGEMIYRGFGGEKVGRIGDFKV
jgi:hypothetical protein